MKKNERRKLVYDTLIKNGYTATEARKLRDVSIKKLAEYVRKEKKSIKVIEKVGKKLKTDNETIKILKDLANYKKIQEQKTDKKYHNKYNYVVEYEKGRKKGGRWTDRETHFMTIQSKKEQNINDEKPLTKKQVYEEFLKWYDGDTEGYNALSLIKSSFKIINIFVKE
jgi:hypothetical protein